MPLIDLDAIERRAQAFPNGDWVWNHHDEPGSIPEKPEDVGYTEIASESSGKQLAVIAARGAVLASITQLFCESRETILALVSEIRSLRETQGTRAERVAHIFVPDEMLEALAKALWEARNVAGARVMIGRRIDTPIRTKMNLDEFPNVELGRGLKVGEFWIWPDTMRAEVKDAWPDA